MKRKSNEQTLREVLNIMFSDAKIKPKYFESRVVYSWEKLMGTTIHNYTKEIRLVNQKLYLSISSAPLKNQLFMEREIIKQRINEELGEDYVLEVIFYS